MIILRPLAALVILMLSLTACESPLPQVSYPELRFNHLPAIKLEVARIEIVEHYSPPLKAPNVEHLLPLAPATALRNWARDRLQAVGTSGTARFIIIEAEVTAVALTKKKGLKAAFTLAQAARYNASLKARLEVEIAGGLGKGFAAAEATRHRTMPENMSINDRDDALYAFIEGAAMDFNRVMTQNIDAHLGPFRR
ncbi:MAG: hypothetical protein VCE74_15530 [Alphaproteobacteria bacterium]|jgi:hypothetical protein